MEERDGCLGQKDGCIKTIVDILTIVAPIAIMGGTYYFTEDAQAALLTGAFVLSVPALASVLKTIKTSELHWEQPLYLAYVFAWVYIIGQMEEQSRQERAFFVALAIPLLFTLGDQIQSIYDKYNKYKNR